MSVRQDWKDAWEFDKSFLKENLTWHADQSRTYNLLRIGATLLVYGGCVFIIVWGVNTLL